ncbi:hypothetical protein N7478_008538 [Penicillium angulare]|uniref:uncharacterized protein n=1 Tax=Penicillium angulare TaxID=116970 RepID=UPI00254082A7|nr:uncharacterized protein N7478_008538 [Penicillium angulare]KAJ5273413.1 hypothetical protein N7478_008538 [Penicillium angulare]
MMRLFNRFYVLCGLAACTMLYSAWFLTSRNFGDIVPLASEEYHTAPEFGERLVVFGDSWSDNETEDLQGKVWTDWLCEKFSCHQENLAETAKSSFRGKYTGSVVDNTELDVLDRVSQTKLKDMKTQLQHWLAAEMKTVKGMSDEDLKSRQDRTIFVVSYGVWDIWSLVSKEYGSACESVDRRIKTIMNQLNILAETWGSDNLKVILTQSVDVTFLPAFLAAYPSQGEEYKTAVKILAYWNARLKEAAKPWEKGTVYLFDTNAFLLDRIRDWQYFAAGITAQDGLGSNEDPGWENVANGCVESEGGITAMVSSKKNKAPCENPEKYLFWNEMTMGPSAHRLMASEVYDGINGVLLNSTEGAQLQQPEEEEKSTEPGSTAPETKVRPDPPTHHKRRRFAA